MKPAAEFEIKQMIEKYNQQSSELKKNTQTYTVELNLFPRK